MIELPNKERAVVPPGKLVDYLLDLNHEDGGSKAKFFIHILGFTRNKPKELEREFLRIAYTGTVSEKKPEPLGDYFIIIDKVRDYGVKTVWMVKNGRDFPELISAYPHKEKQ